MLSGSVLSGTVLVTDRRGSPVVLDVPASPVIVWFSGDHDISTAGQVDHSLTRAIALGSAKIVIDMSGVKFIDASTLGAMVRARNTLLAQSREIYIRRPPDRVLRTIAAAGLECLLPGGGS